MNIQTITGKTRIGTKNNFRKKYTFFGKKIVDYSYAKH